MERAQELQDTLKSLAELVPMLALGGITIAVLGVIAVGVFTLKVAFARQR